MNGLNLISPRYPVADRLRHGLGVAAIVLVAIMAWKWRSGTFRADIDLAWLVMMAGIFASDIIRRRAGRAKERATEEAA